MKKDNCTLFFEGNWSECCARHDKRYENKRLTRKQADRLLYRCVHKKSKKVVALIMYVGVRAFGWYFYRKVNQIKEKR